MKCDFDLDKTFLDFFVTRNRDNICMEDFPTFVELPNIFSESTLVEVFSLMGLLATCIKDGNL